MKKQTTYNIYDAQTQVQIISTKDTTVLHSYDDKFKTGEYVCFSNATNFEKNREYEFLKSRKNDGNEVFEAAISEMTGFYSDYYDAKKQAAIDFVATYKALIDDKFAIQVCESVIKYQKASEKQVHIIAKAIAATNKFTTNTNSHIISK